MYFVEAGKLCNHLNNEAFLKIITAFLIKFTVLLYNS